MTKDVIKSDGARAAIYRDAPRWDGMKTASIGDFRCEDAETGAALLRQITETVATEGFSAVIGPMNGNTWNSYRLVSESDGRSPFLMEPTSNSHDAEAFKQAGFDTIGRYFSASASVADTLATLPQADDRIEVTTWDGTKPEEHFSNVYDLSIKAFSDNAFYTPISREVFLEMYMPFVPLLRKELILLARDSATGELVGFLFGIPNFQEGQAPESVILKTYASLQPGAGRALSKAFHQAAHDLGFKTAIHALIHDDNDSAERSRMHGATVFRRYDLMGLRIDG
ncbi:hypothetical protein [Aliiroseovarius sp. YM-037]|uniref:hypothetical protein n=1 Tax=Aliiroseovarius sp. YM-037 TaxID=3341728 RepID=UPI003A7FF1B2